MKKWYAVFLFILIFGLYGVAKAGYSYNRTPAGTGSITNPVTFSVSWDSRADNPCLDDDSFWTIKVSGAIEHFSPFVSNLTLNQTWVTDLPLGQYYSVGLVCWTSSYVRDPRRSMDFESYIPPFLFEVVSPPKGWFSGEFATSTFFIMSALIGGIATPVELILGVFIVGWIIIFLIGEFEDRSKK